MVTVEASTQAAAVDRESAEVVADIRARLGFISAQAQLVSELIAAREGAIPTEATLDLLATSKRARRSVRSVEYLLEDAVIANMTMDGVRQVDGADYTAVLHDGGTRKDWRTQDVVGMLVKRFASGAVKRFPHLPAVDVETIVADALWNLTSAARLAFRSTVLRRLDIDPNQYSRIEPNRASIELRGAATYPEFTPDDEGDDD